MTARSLVRRGLLPLLLALLLPAGARAQDAHPDAGSKAGVQFLKLGHGPAGAALADGLTAWRGTAEAVHWNPAAVVGSPTGDGAWQEISLAGATLYGDERLTSLIWGRGSARGGIACEVSYSGISGIEVRDGPTAEPLALTSAHDIAAALTGGLSFSGGLSIGISVRGLYEKLYRYDAFGAALDAGLQLPLPGSEGLLRAGLAVRNLGRMGRLDQERLQLPWSVAGGIALARPLTFGSVTVRAGADLWKPSDDWAQFRFGVQARSSPLIFRAGTRQGKNWHIVTAGLGLCFGAWTIDYSYEYDPDTNRHFLGSIQRLGLVVNLQTSGAQAGH